MFADIAGQLRVGVAGEDMDIILGHGVVYPRASWDFGKISSKKLC
jgi:hypothetical protein